MEYLKRLKEKEYLIDMRLVFILLSITLASCSSKVPYNFIQGQTMGTTYHITFQTEDVDRLQFGIDSILWGFNMILSTYIDTSLISKFNKSESGVEYTSIGHDYFSEVFSISEQVYRNTYGAFDPTVMPLVNYYGFGYQPKKSSGIDTDSIKTILNYVGYDLVSLENKENENYIAKSNPKVELDFSSIAKGYGVDIVCKYLMDKGIHNYLVEIGGETRAKGVNPRGKVWSIGINVPDPEAPVSDYLFPIRLDNKSVATSGNYRNFYVSDSITYVHIIDPVSGLSKPSDMLSATIVAESCAIADAYATASIVMGSERAMELINSLEGIEACFILADKGNYKMLYSSEFKSLINE